MRPYFNIGVEYLTYQCPGSDNARYVVVYINNSGDIIDICYDPCWNEQLEGNYDTVYGSDDRVYVKLKKMYNFESAKIDF